MKKQIKFRLAAAVLLLVIGAFAQKASAQGMKDIKINEILVINNESYADDHAAHNSWIELYNSGYSNVNVGGTYLTTRVGDATRTYRIPKNDARTLIPPQGYLIFFADSSSNKGTFHTNFVLDETGTLVILDQGRNVVDSVTYDVAAQKPDISIGRIFTLGNDEQKFGELPGITPMQSNDVEERVEPGEIFRLRDPLGIVMALTAMSVVFTALAVLYLIFKNLGKFMAGGVARKEKNAIAQMSDAVQAAVKPEGDIIGEEIAAIAMALRRYEEDLHDIESQVLTINKVARAYSPWSSKIYGLRQLPQRNNKSRS